jgi:hypothetical protein
VGGMFVTDQLCSYAVAKVEIPEVAKVKHVFIEAAARRSFYDSVDQTAGHQIASAVSKPIETERANGKRVLSQKRLRCSREII